jgi:Carboxypeptidase regulatory-like domain
MANTKIRVEVALCPDKALENAAPDSTWPRPAGLAVQFREDIAGAADMPAATNSSGIATSPELAPGNYEVQIEHADLDLSGPGMHWDPKYALPLKVDLEKAKHRQRILLIPPADHRLLPLLLRGDGQGGETIPLDLAEATMVADEPAEWDDHFSARSDGHIYALVPHVDRHGEAITRVRIHLEEARVGKRLFVPRHEEITITVPDPVDPLVEQPILYYEPAEPSRQPFRGISVEPTILDLSGDEVPLTGAMVSVELQHAPPGTVPRVKKMEADEKHVRFPNLEPGLYLITVTPPGAFDGWPLKAKPKKIGPHYLRASDDLREKAGPFQFEQINGIVTTPNDRPLDEDFQLVIFGPDGSAQVMVHSQKFAAAPPSAPPLRIKLGAGAAPEIGGIPLEMETPDQAVEPPGQPTVVALQYAHSVDGRAVDESRTPMSGAVIIIYDGKNEVARTVAADDGTFVAGLKASGRYSIAIQTEGGQPVTQQLVSVNSPAHMGDLIFRRWEPPQRDGSGQDHDRKDDSGPGRATREAFTDLAAYPVLTEEISTTGVPAPVAGGTGGGGGAGAAYAQVVDQAMRDVLGWRPGGDLAGFQAALTGAFQLREVEGHTEWSWQQRGYAVQADMGALAGAQASIYARAKAALDQIQPLLAGLTTLNPSKYEPQDLETIRSVVSTELRELVGELAREGGPRIQRVDELFGLLLGEGRKSRDLDPDQVQGNLGTLRQRFALTVDEIQTVDEERIVTNFRIIVEQVLALHASWNFDRKLLSGVGPKAALGTILIWLSRGLEAVCESVGDLLFALDSVFVDAAQRQVIQLRFGGLTVDVPEVPFKGNPPQTITEHLQHQAPMFLSDLLDWVLRVSRDEGPRIIQDAGKDGVLAFKPVLNTLRVLVRATAKIAHEHHGQNAMPAGMRTPRVDRAIKVLAAQLDEAANLASLVRVEVAPQIASASICNPTDHLPVSMAALRVLSQIEIVMTGSNFRGPAKAILTAEQNEDLDPLRANVTINTPSSASAIFNNPNTDSANAGTTWVVSIINNDGTQSVPIEVLRVPR